MLKFNSGEYFTVNRYVFEPNKQVNVKDRMIHIVLASQSNAEGVAYATYKEISQMSGVSEKTIKPSIERQGNENWLAVEKQSQIKGQKNGASKYELTKRDTEKKYFRIPYAIMKDETIIKSKTVLHVSDFNGKTKETEVKLKAEEIKLVYFYLIYRATTSGEFSSHSQPSYKEIAVGCGMRDDVKLRAIMSDLEAIKLITIEKTYKETEKGEIQYARNLYKLNDINQAFTYEHKRQPGTAKGKVINIGRRRETKMEKNEAGFYVPSKNNQQTKKPNAFDPFGFRQEKTPGIRAESN